jgi:hypothetical protein
MSGVPLEREIVHWTAPTSSSSSSSVSSSSGASSTGSSSSNTTASLSSSAAAVAAVPRPAYDAQSDCDSVKALADIFAPTAAEALEREPFTVPQLKGLALTSPLDYSQRVAVASALSQELTIVQGPPGTGKTFIGCMLAQVRSLSVCARWCCITYIHTT